MSHTRELDGAWAGTCWLKRSYDIDSRKLKVSYMALVLPQSGSFYPVFSPPPPPREPLVPIPLYHLPIGHHTRPPGAYTRYSRHDSQGHASDALSLHRRPHTDHLPRLVAYPFQFATSVL